MFDVRVKHAGAASLLAVLLSLLLVCYSSPRAGAIVAPLVVAALLFGYFLPDRFMSAFFFLIPFSGLVSNFVGLRGAPLLLPVFFAGAAGACGHLSKKQTHSFSLSIRDSAVIFGINACVSAIVAVAGFYPWGGPTHLVAVTPWGAVLFANAIGWLTLAFLVNIAGLTSFLWLSHARNAERDFVWICLAFLAAGVFGWMQYTHRTHFGVIAQFLRSGKPQYNATFVDPNALGLSCAIVFAIWCGRLWQRALRVNFFEWLAGPTLLFLVLIAGTRSAYILSVVSITVFFILLLIRRPVVAAVAFLFLASVGFLLIREQRRRNPEASRLVVFGQQVRRIALGQMKPMAVFTDRTMQWSSAWATFQANPLLGVGAGTYLIRSPAYQTVMGRRLNDNAGSQYLQVLAEQGVIGFAVFLFLIGSTVKEFLLSRDKNPMQSGAFAALVGIMISFIFGSHIVGFEVAMYFWLCLSLLRKRSAHQSNEYSN